MSDEPTMHWYDAKGKRVPEGSPDAVAQYLDDDPSRPDAAPKDAPAPAEAKAVDAPAGDKAQHRAANK